MAIVPENTAICCQKRGVTSELLLGNRFSTPYLKKPPHLTQFLNRAGHPAGEKGTYGNDSVGDVQSPKQIGFLQ